MKRFQLLSLLLVFILLLTATSYTWAQGPARSTSVGVPIEETPVEETPVPDPATPQPPSPGLDIVGGTEAAPGAWPWMAALVDSGESNAFNGQFCGGALIRPRWVLTAAHCTEDTNPSEVDVVVGRHTLSSSDGERISVMEIVVHPSYDPDTNDSDIALLHLLTASSQPTIAVVDAVDGPLFAPGIVATVIGWGDTIGTGQPSYSDALRQVSVPIVSNATCNAPQSYGGDVSSNMLRAGYAQGGKDSCSGDSGGPLMVRDAQGDGWMQAGIVSWGDREGGECLLITVRDNGEGIPTEDLPHVFDRFYRADRSRTRHSGGRGLGLAIVKQIVELHGGCVWVESQPGTGTAFFSSIPWKRIEPGSRVLAEQKVTSA